MTESLRLQLSLQQENPVTGVNAIVARSLQ